MPYSYDRDAALSNDALNPDSTDSKESESSTDTTVRQINVGWKGSTREVDPNTGETIRDLPSTKTRVSGPSGGSRSRPRKLTTTKTPRQSQNNEPKVADLRQDPGPQSRSLETYKQTVVYDTGRRVSYEQLQRKREADRLARNIALKGSLPESTRGLDPGKGRIELEFKQVPVEKKPSRLSQAWTKLNTPIDLESVPVVGPQLNNMQRRTAMLMGTALSFNRKAAQDLGRVNNPVVSRVGSAADTLMEWEQDALLFWERDLRTPSTWALAGAGSMIQKGALPVLKTVPGAGKIAASPTLGKIAKTSALSVYGGLQLSDIRSGEKTPGQVIGETGALLTAYSFVDPAITKGQQIFRQWRDNRQWQRLLRSVESPYNQDFKLRDLASGQKDLWGRTVPDKKIQQTLQQLDRNKVGFGLEQNTLNPYRDTIRPTGQLRLSRDQIVAVDSFGNMQNVRVVDHQPYVYDPAVKKYVEFDPQKWFLRTFKTSPIGDPDLETLRAQSFKALFNPATSTQTELPREIVRSVSMKPLPDLKPFQPPPPPPPSPTPSAPGSTGVEYMTVPRADTFSFQVPRTVATISNYVPPTAQTTPSPPLTDSNQGIGVLLPKLNIFTPPQTRTEISAFTSPTERQSGIQDSRPRQDPLNDILRATREAVDSVIIPAQTPQSSTKPATRSGQVQQNIQLPDFAPSPQPPAPPRTPPILDLFTLPAEPAPPEVPGLPTWILSRQTRKGPARGPAPIKPQQPRAFFPTFKSSFLREIGITLRRNILTGLGDRYIPKKSKKKQRRRIS